jgi:hypothetical protein
VHIFGTRGHLILWTFTAIDIGYARKNNLFKMEFSVIKCAVGNDFAGGSR